MQWSCPRINVGSKTETAVSFELSRQVSYVGRNIADAAAIGEVRSLDVRSFEVRSLEIRNTKIAL